MKITAFTNAFIERTLFKSTHLKFMDFTGSDLCYVDFSNAKLDGCNFTQSQLYMANFTGVDDNHMHYLDANFFSSSIDSISELEQVYTLLKERLLTITSGGSAIPCYFGYSWEKNGIFTAIAQSFTKQLLAIKDVSIREKIELLGKVKKDFGFNQTHTGFFRIEPESNSPLGILIQAEKVLYKQDASNKWNIKNIVNYYMGYRG